MGGWVDGWAGGGWWVKVGREWCGIHQIMQRSCEVRTRGINSGMPKYTGHTSHACRACMRGTARTPMSICNALKACFEGM